MKINLKQIQSKITRNFEFFFVLLLILISIVITQVYNSSKNQAQKQYIKILNNLYFQKTVKDVFNNFSPKYVNIEHIVTQNESLNSILKKYEIDDKELKLITKELNSKLPNYKLRVGNFVNRKEAESFQKKIVRLGYRTAWVVPTMIEKDD